MANYVYFPVAGTGLTASDPYIWNVGTIPFDSPSFWDNVDDTPLYPAHTGTTPGAGDTVYIVAGSAQNAIVDQVYSADPNRGRPYLGLTGGADGTTVLPADVTISGTVDVASVGLEAITASSTIEVPTLDVEGGTLKVAGGLRDNIPPADLPFQLGTLVEDAGFLFLLYGYHIPTAGGEVIIGAGGTVEVGTTIDAGINVHFNDGAGDLLKLDIPKSAAVGGTITVAGTITNFVAGDTIELTGLNGASINSVSYDAATGILDINVGDPVDYLLHVQGPGLSASSFGFAGDSIVTCFAAGTRIAAAGRQVAVEALRPGDTVITLLSGPQPVRWIGHRRVDPASHPRPDDVRPVRVAAGAFGPGLPARDLFLSPDHALYLDGALVPVRHLIDGGLIAYAPMPRSVTYYHVELAGHDVLLAEGLPVESYLDAGNRAAFANGGPCASLHPDFTARAWEAEGCAPLQIVGPVVDAARAALARAAGHRGRRSGRTLRRRA